MPELPEVETVRRGLLEVMDGVRIVRVETRRADLRRPFPENMVARLEGARVLGLRRRSKYILVDLDTDESLIVHLGMSGKMLITGGASGMVVREPEKHDHVVMDLESGVRISFNDVRRFGLMDLAETVGVDAHPLLAAIGPEPLGNAFSPGYLFEAFQGRKTPVKSALLDQRIVAGLGNIYVCEALWRSRISPFRLAGEVTAEEVAELYRSIVDVLSEAIEAGGSSVRDYRSAGGDLGYFQLRISVYGREGLPCTRDGCTGVVERAVQAGRSSFHCPTCQVRG
ncbi:bifunctional DNA-formamidopyrimidine glycosylase/DNA-(apurinic or apyrimidinic site) lyase [Amaricoccus tamworthensis]|uniref:bifunctional DNA-formamidopyrimidine glycosylase/DNA-(apurinic or apyrimidinic site) lyase n=1 Tax=Amaricoccus tamworthensis TaxID=57002 RepID=UPI003C7D0368